jgi:1-acyl-sn-glycerol-3-phosphate acyltransferase
MRPFSHAAVALPRVGEALPRRGNQFTQAAATLLLRAFGWRIEGDVPDVSKAVIVGAPHTSNWDFVLTLLTASALGVRLQWVGKHTLFRGPLGWFMRSAGGIPVDRRVSTGFVGAMVAEFRRRPAFLLAIMPQGTRGPSRPWKTGFHFIARGAEVPIVPVAFDYGHQAVRFGPAFTPSDDLTRDIAAIQSYFVDVRGKYPHA